MKQPKLSKEEFRAQEKKLEAIQPLAQKAIKELGLIGAVVQSGFSGRPSLDVIINREDNGRAWNDEWRELMNVLCGKLSDLGLLWAAEYDGFNQLITKDENGEPWMLFNGSCVSLKAA